MKLLAKPDGHRAAGRSRITKCRTLALLALVCGLHLLPARGQANSEYEVKAAFLLNFAKFIQWPPDAFATDQSPLLVCVTGADPFGPALDMLVKGKTIDSHVIAVRRVNNPEALKACQVVFVSGGGDRHLPEILRQLKGSSTLAVGESRDFAGLGGGIQFYLENNKIRFCINVDALQRAHLTASSKLLALAKIVHDEGPKNGE